MKFRPIAAMLCTAFATLLMLVFTVAGMPNSSEQQLRTMKLWAGGLCVLSLVCIGIGMVLTARGHFGPAAVVAFLPTFVMGCIFLYLLM